MSSLGNNVKYIPKSKKVSRRNVQIDLVSIRRLKSIDMMLRKNSFVFEVLNFSSLKVDYEDFCWLINVLKIKSNDKMIHFKDSQGFLTSKQFKTWNF